MRQIFLSPAYLRQLKNFPEIQNGIALTAESDKISSDLMSVWGKKKCAHVPMFVKTWPSIRVWNAHQTQQASTHERSNDPKECTLQCPTGRLRAVGKRKPTPCISARFSCTVGFVFAATISVMIKKVPSVGNEPVLQQPPRAGQ